MDRNDIPDADKANGSCAVLSHKSGIVDAAYFEAAVRYANDAIITKNLDGIITSWNAAAERLYGYEAAEAIGRHINLIVPQRLHGDMKLELQELSAGLSRMEYETVRLNKAGEEIPVSLNVSPVKSEDGRVIGVSGIVRDLRETKNAQVNLQKAKARNEAVMNAVLDGLITFDADGAIQSLNPAAARMFGFSEKDAIGKNIALIIADTHGLPHEGRPSEMQSSDVTGIIGAMREITAQRKDASEFPAEVSVNDTVIEDGRIFVCTIRDITGRKQAEDQIHQYVEKLKRSNQDLDEFAYIASHDLKEPLRGLSNNAMFLKEDFGDKLDEGAQKRLRRMVYLCERLENLVNDLLYFSRIGRQELAIQRTDLNEVLAGIADTLAASQQDEDVSIAIPRALPTIVCDKTRIAELYRNLITNAIKYNDKKEKLIEIGYEEEPGQGAGEPQHIFFVKDNGEGIPKEFYEDVFRIFKRLKRVEPESNGAPCGTGSGLTFVRKIVERHNGRVWIDSEVGKGTTFFFTLNAAGGASYA